MDSILLLHGALGSKEQLVPLSESLSKNFQVFSINFSGHGGLPIPNEFSIPLFANDVITFLNLNQIKKVNIFGYSMGGYVALYLAKHYSDRIKKIVTFATKFSWNTAIAEKEIKMLDVDKIKLKIPNFAYQLFIRHEPVDWKIVMKKTSDMMLGLGENNTLKLNDYLDIKHRVLIMIGDKDNMVSFGETLEVYKKLPNANFCCLQNTQHPIERININKLSDEIYQFLKSSE